MEKVINIPIKVSTYSDSCMFDTPDQMLVKIANYENTESPKPASIIFLRLGGGGVKTCNKSFYK